VGVLKALRRRKWRLAVNGEFRRRHGVDLRTIGEMIGSTTLRHLLNDEYELAPHSPVVGARNVAQMLGHVYRVDIGVLATREFALTMAPFRTAATRATRPAVRDAWDAPAGRGAPARSVAAALTRS
jgi:hypothetical protein